MKRVLTLLIAIFAITTLSHGQGALLVQGGYSWSEGVVAAGYQFGTLSTTFGYMPTKMPGDGDPVSGIVWNVKWGPEWDESGYYLSYAYNSVGYRSQISYNNGPYGSDYVEGMHIISLGYKVGTYSMYLAADVGYGWSDSASGTSWGIIIGFPLMGF